MKPRIRKLVSTLGYQLAIDNETQFRATHVDSPYTNLEIGHEDLVIRRTLDKHTVELLRDFFAHVAKDMQEVQGV